tara:strand:+ start:332 stop:589 length:258 start_codon:yes stop_codon:yes gene_type:complete
MSKISTYASIQAPSIDDKLIGTDIENENLTKNFTIDSILNLLSTAAIVLPVYATNTAALAAGLSAGNLYRNAGAAGSSSVVCVVY